MTYFISHATNNQRFDLLMVASILERYLGHVGDGMSVWLRPETKRRAQDATTSGAWQIINQVVIGVQQDLFRDGSETGKLCAVGGVENGVEQLCLARLGPIRHGSWGHIR